jgi:hemolysin III
MNIINSFRQLSPVEAWNTLSHAAGAVAAAVGSAVLIPLAAQTGNVWQVVSAVVFSAALILMYVASSSYHAAQHPVAKRRLEILDHAAIYILIAGTYTPFMLVTLNGTLGWSLLAVVWGMALVGVVLKLFFTGRYVLLSTLMYLAMGWLVVLAFPSLKSSISLWGLVWLVVGGLLYTGGTFFFLQKRRPYAHVVWHFFVLSGSACHFVAVWSQVV